MSALGAQALAAEVKGQLLLGAYQPAAKEKSPRAGFHWELENGVKEVVRDRVPARELAVVLVGEGPSTVAERIEVPFSGGALSPSTLVVRVGTTLRMRNDDEIGHELYAEGLDGFSAEATSPKAIRSVHLTKPGSYALRDKLATHARSYLHVLPDLVAVAKLEPSGAFVFSDVPAGKYQLKVFHGRELVSEKAVEVAEKALTLDAFALGEAKASP